MLRTVSGIGTVRAKSVFAKGKIGRQATGTSCHWRKLICLFDSEGGVRTLTFDSTFSRQVFLKNRVWQRRLVVPGGSYTRRTLAIGR